MKENEESEVWNFFLLETNELLNVDGRPAGIQFGPKTNFSKKLQKYLKEKEQSFANRVELVYL